MHLFRVARSVAVLFAVCVVGSYVAGHALAEEPRLALSKGNRIVLIGNTLAERMQYFGNWETLLHSRFPELELVVRDLGWSADELTLRPRSQDFQNHGHRLEDHKPNVVIAMFGFNESFGGHKGLTKFEGDLEKFIQETTTTKYEGANPPQLVLVSPIAHENLGVRTLPDGAKNNENIKLYTDAMGKLAARHKIVFVDLFTPSSKQMPGSKEKWTINGIHLNEYGDAQVAKLLDEALFGARPASSKADLAKLHREVNEKNWQHFMDYRAVNGFYIYGGRKDPFGVVNFPAEFSKLRKMIANRDQRIWQVAQGKDVSDQIDDSNTGDLAQIETNYKNPITLSNPQQELESFKVAEGYQVNLFASEAEFPDLAKPVQFEFDNKGRMFVTVMPSYPMYLPGADKPNDKVLILEDADGDGHADSSKVFADGLHVPTGIELGDGGVYVANQPNLLFLKDTNGDDKADTRQIRLHGFDTADSHHSISAFTWGQDGALYFEEGTFHRTQVETPYGPKREHDAAVFRYEPLTEKFEVYVSYGFANPWGHVYDRWGQDFVADASGGANYYATAFSGQVDYPNKHGGMQQFLKMQWRPTCGNEFVTSRHFPESAQGNYLLNNCIGFQGVLQYKMRDEGSGFFAEPIEPLLQSKDQNCRPVDLKFGPDGALYVIDWFNPLIGHMQHSIRDPNRDKTHGRIWRITYKGRPLAKPPQIAGASVPALLDLLKEYEDRTRYRVRRELRARNTQEVMSALEPWIAGLDKNDKEYEHHMLEALWVHQQHDVVNADLLKRMLRSPDFRARAAATRVLCYWRDRVDEPLELIRTQITDEHPRVRLEAVRACSFFHDPKATEVALESLAAPQDGYLEYTLKETLNTLEKREKAAK